MKWLVSTPEKQTPWYSCLLHQGLKLVMIFFFGFDIFYQVVIITVSYSFFLSSCYLTISIAKFTHTFLWGADL